MDKIAPKRETAFPIQREGQFFREPREQALGMDLIDYIRILQRRQWSILAVFLIVVGMSFIYSFLATKVYMARSALIIRVGAPSTIIRSQEIQFPNYLSLRSEFDTMIKLITSRPIMVQVAKKLVEQGYYRPENFDKMTEKEREDYFQKLGISLQGKARTKQIEKTNLIYIYVENTDPGLAALIANLIAEEMVNYNQLEQEMVAKNSLNFLNQQLEEARIRLEEAETKLAKYKSENKIFETELDKTNIASQRTSLRENYMLTRASRLEIESRIDGIKRLLAKKDYTKYTPIVGGNDLLNSLNSQLSEALVKYQMLTKEYQDMHPEVVKLREQINILQKNFEDELTKVIAKLEIERNVLLAREQEMENLISGLESEAMSITQKDIKYTEIEREADSARELFNNLLSAVKEANIQANGTLKNIVYVHEYSLIPSAPVRPNKLLNLGIGLVLGLVLGVGWAFFLEVFDRSVKYPEDVEIHTHLPILSLLPRVESATTEHGRYQLLSLEHPKSLYSEGILNLRANLRNYLKDYNINTLLISSATPKEGKSMVTANLGISLAQDGIRTLIADCDLRRPIQHKFFRYEKAQGVTQAIIELFQAPIEEHIGDYSFGDLHLLMQLQRRTGLLNLYFNSNGTPLRFLYQQGRVMASNLREWAKSGIHLEDITQEDIKLELNESISRQILPAVKEEEIKEFLEQFPELSRPLYISSRLYNDYTRPCHIEGLRILTSGPIPSNPGEILGSVQFRSMIELLKPYFDVILFDTPPCWPLSDVSLLAPMMDGMLFVIRAKKVTRDLLVRNLQQLYQLNLRVLGAVFNDVDFKREKYYYGYYSHYHYYYYYYYHYGYGRETES